jgi:hypothetical protein
VNIKPDLVWIVCGVDDAADRFSLFDLLPFDAQKLGQPPALPDGDEIEPVAAPSAPNSGSTTRFCRIPLAAMLAAQASMAASLCGILWAFFGDFLSLLSGMKTAVPLATVAAPKKPRAKV